MRTLIRMFFRTLRLVLMPFMLLWAKLAMPKGVVRSADAQQQVERECAKMALYHFKTCPFCIKVRHEMGRLSLPIELRDAQHDAEHKEALLQGGSKVQTPCLRITGKDGQVQWLYESGDIIRYLQQRFA
ncbi:MAG: glutathione S-transferase N-terminal domain-containing protein [Gammaproteobacteria bacterium]|nr:glutaredoxin [Sideroxydans sp.]MBU4046493.1 glutathione S-transferase N-terminal domain-containing protein [Gammaproteobacteria bacterium]